MEADGFQADTEDDEEDDCVIISTQSGELHRKNTNLSSSALNDYTNSDHLNFCFLMIFKTNGQAHITQTTSLLCFCKDMHRKMCWG